MSNAVKEIIELHRVKNEHLKTLLMKLLEQVRKDERENEPTNYVDRLLEEFALLYNVTEQCISCITLICNPSSEILWYPKVEDQLNVSYLSGNSPWSFSLTYNLSNEISVLTKSMESKFLSGALVPIEEPEVGSYVCCWDSISCFRGFILKTLPKKLLRVLNVDTNQVKPIKMDSCYKLDKEFTELHANTIQCCLTKSAFNEKKWHSVLTDLFQNTLRDSRLSIKIIEKIDSTPPKFLVELFAYNETFKVQTNISHWVCSKLLPALAMFDREIDEDELYNFLDEDVLDPFICMPQLCQSTGQSDSEECCTAIKKEDKIERNDLSKTEKNMLECKKGAVSSPEREQNLLECKQEVESSAKREQNMLECKHETGSSPEGEQNMLECTQKTGSLPERKQNKLEFAEDRGSSPEKFNNLLENVVDTKTTSKFTFESVLDVPEFSPVSATLSSLSAPSGYHGNSVIASNRQNNNVCPHFWTRGSCRDPDCIMQIKTQVNSGPDVLNGCVDNSVVPYNYFPKDDHELCAQFVRTGSCWKTSCLKKHITPALPDKWTNDDAEVFIADQINNITLPPVGAKTTIMATHVIKPNMFYGVFTDSYTDNEDDEEETVVSLITSLNTRETLSKLKCLTTPPCFAQLLIAYSEIKKKWLRCSVVDVLDEDEISVLFIDLGIPENVNIAKCREILPEHIHLPYQAVVCSLSGLSFEESKEKEGKEFLENFILNQEIDVTVINCMEEDTRIEIAAVTSTGIDLSELMVNRGYCYRREYK